MKRWVIGVSGSSGMPYALKLMQTLAQSQIELHVVFSEAALRVLQEEMGIKCSQSTISSKLLFASEVESPHCPIKFYNPKDIGAWFASGSAVFEGMVIVPCSMASLGMIANGCGHNLIHRAADVCIKEDRKLIIVPRETPLSSIHLANMLKLTQLGIKMIAAMPGFYNQPVTIQDLVDSLVMKILDSMDIENTLAPRWGQDKESNPTQQEGILIPFKGGRS